MGVVKRRDRIFVLKLQVNSSRLCFTYFIKKTTKPLKRIFAPLFSIKGFGHSIIEVFECSHLVTPAAALHGLGVPQAWLSQRQQLEAPRWAVGVSPVPASWARHFHGGIKGISDELILHVDFAARFTLHFVMFCH